MYIEFIARMIKLSVVTLTLGSGATVVVASAVLVVVVVVVVVNSWPRHR